MKKNYWLIAVLIALSGDLTGILLDNNLVQYICKPLLIPLLIGYFAATVKPGGTTWTKWILVALFFSWLGDVLLMFVSKNENFFLAGLASFLLAHICYILFFHQVRMTEKIKPRIWALLVVVVYYGLLIYLLSPYLGEMKWPVRIYGIVISIMCMLAMHMLYIKNKKAGQWVMIGALLFVASDSVLAINKFYQPFDGAGIIIMLTYGLAQLFIVKGAVEYIGE